MEKMLKIYFSIKNFKNVLSILSTNKKRGVLVKAKAKLRKKSFRLQDEGCQVLDFEL